MSYTKGGNRASATVAASQTDSAFIAAPIAGMKIVVMQLAIVNGATGTSTLALNSKGSGAGTLVTGLPASFVLAASGTLVLPFSQDGWFEAKPGEAMTISTGAGNTTNAFFIATYRITA